MAKPNDTRRPAMAKKMRGEAGIQNQGGVGEVGSADGDVELIQS